MNWLTNFWSEKKPAPKYRCLSLQCQATFETEEARNEHEEKFHGEITEEN